MTQYDWLFGLPAVSSEQYDWAFGVPIVVYNKLASAAPKNNAIAALMSEGII